MSVLRFDTNGVELADVPGSGISKVDPNAKSGNPHHDSRSGKFGSGGGKGSRTQAPANTDPVEYMRMLDAVRDAAREFDSPDEGDIREFLAGRAKAPDQVDIQNFMSQVQAQRLNDMVDMLDQQIRASGPMKRGRRKIRITAPRGFMQRAIRSLDDNSLGQIMHRLEAMGHDAEDVRKFFSGKHKAVEVADEQKKVAASDGIFWATGGLITEMPAVEEQEPELPESQQNVINLTVVVAEGDDADEIAQKIRDAVSAATS